MAIAGLDIVTKPIRTRSRLRRGDGDPVAASVIRAAHRRDLTAVRDTLAQYDGHDRSLLLAAISSNSPDAYLWLQSEPKMGEHEALDRLLLGSVTVGHAWRARTGLRPQYVSRQRFAAFHGHLREAEVHLHAVAKLEPSWAEPWSLLTNTARGLQLGADVGRQRFEATVTRCPGHSLAHRQMLQLLCRKWAGSHEQMHAFAADAASGPYRSTLAHLVALAHIEHRLDLVSVLRKGAAHAYMKQNEVRAELREAAEASLFSPREVDPRSPYFEANVFAMAFSLAGMRSEAKRAFALTNGIVTRFPWEYRSREVVRVFARFRMLSRFSRTAS